MDYKEYKQLYNQLLSEKGLAELGDDPNRVAAVEQKINQFLEQYPKTIPVDKKKTTPITELSVREIYKRCLMIAIDIINDISRILSQRDTLSNAELRRQIFASITSPERRVYVGIWLIFISIVLYFIDSSS